MQTPPSVSSDIVRSYYLLCCVSEWKSYVDIMKIQEQTLEDIKPSLSTAETKLYQVSIFVQVSSDVTFVLTDCMYIRMR